MWTALGWGLVLAFWPLYFLASALASSLRVGLSPEVPVILFLGFVSLSSSLVWVSFLRWTQHLLPRRPRWSWVPVSTGLYLSVGAILVTTVVVLRSLGGVQFSVLVDARFAWLVFLGWPFMSVFMAVFQPN